MACLNEGDSKHAPRYSLPARRLGALEHPLIIRNVDRGIQTFGTNPSFQAVKQTLFFSQKDSTVIDMLVDSRLGKPSDLSAALFAS
jgi:hypothetical protein